MDDDIFSFELTVAIDDEPALTVSHEAITWAKAHEVLNRIEAEHRARLKARIHADG